MNHVVESPRGGVGRRDHVVETPRGGVGRVDHAVESPMGGVAREDSSLSHTNNLDRSYQSIISTVSRGVTYDTLRHKSLAR